MNDEVRWPLSLLRETAKVREPGYLEKLTASGRIETDPKHGEVLIISGAAYAALKANPPGLGDKVAQVAKPVAKIIDAVAGTRIEDCLGCAGRQVWLNEAFPSVPVPAVASEERLKDT